MASNLPPGVHEGMIPGNRPEDGQIDAFYNALDRKMEEEHPDLVPFLNKATQEGDPRMNDAVLAYAELAWHIGRTDGWDERKAEEEIERAMEAQRASEDASA